MARTRRRRKRNACDDGPRGARERVSVAQETEDLDEALAWLRDNTVPRRTFGGQREVDDIWDLVDTALSRIMAATEAAGDFTAEIELDEDGG
jgi:hypothetical protein